MPKQPASKNDVPAKDTVVPDPAGEKSAKNAQAPKQPGTRKAPMGKDRATTAEPKPSGPASDSVMKGAAGEKHTVSARTDGSTTERHPGLKGAGAQPAKTQITDASVEPANGDSAQKGAAKKTPASEQGKAPAIEGTESATRKPQASGKNAANATPMSQQPRNATDAKTPNRNSKVSGKEPVLPKPGVSAPDTESAGTSKPVAKPAVKPVHDEAAKTQPKAARPAAVATGKQAMKLPGTSPESKNQPTAKSETTPGTESAGTKVVPPVQAPKNSRKPKAVSTPVKAVDPQQAPAVAGEPVAAAAASSNKPRTKETAPANVPEKRVGLTATQPATESASTAKGTPVPVSAVDSTTPSAADKGTVPEETPGEPAPLTRSTPGNQRDQAAKGPSRGLMMVLMTVSFILEVALLGAVAIWGMAELPFSSAVAIIITVVPLVILWAVFMSPKASLRLPQPFHAVVAHVLFAIGAGLLALSGQPVLALCMGVLIAVSLALTVAVRGQNVAGRPPKGTGRRAAR